MTYRSAARRGRQPPNLARKAAPWENAMTINRRHVLTGALAAPALIAASRLGSAAPAQTLKTSHQFPGGTIDDGDFRDRLRRKFAAEPETRTQQARAAPGPAHPATTEPPA